MSVFTDNSYIGGLEAFSDENEDVGHFASLNLNYNCSEYAIKKYPY